jgi:hypothetical protein
VQAAFAGLYTVTRAALKMPVGTMKKRAFGEDLDALGFPVNLKKQLAAVVYGEG